MLQTNPTAAELLAKPDRALKALEASQRENVLRRLFGARSEQISPDQLELPLAQDEGPPALVTKPSRRCP